MIEWIVTSSLLILLVAALRLAVKGRVGPRLRYALWAVVLLRLLVPGQLIHLPAAVPAVPEATQVQARLEEETIYVLPIQTTPVEDAGLVTVRDGAVVEDASPFGHARLEDEGRTVVRYAEKLSPLEVLRAVWLAGAAAVAVFFLAVNLRFFFRLRRNRWFLPAWEGRLVYAVEGIASPCLFGLLDPAIYLTPDCTENERAKAHVLAHELTHYRQGDHLWAVLRGAALALHWYNPLVWWAAAMSRRDCELSCDAGAVRLLGEEQRADYGRTLVALVTRRTQPADLISCATTMTGGKSELKERIAALVKRQRTTALMLCAVVLVAAVAVACSFVGGEEKAPVAGVEDAAPEQPVIPTPAPPVEQTPEEKPTPGPAAPAAERDYVLETYTQAPNEKSSISIQYPRFTDQDMEPLNQRIYEEVERFIHEPLAMYGEDTGLTIEYQSCVTLQNSRVASIVFWGWSEVERSAHPFTDLRPLNIDLATMEELELEDLYTVEKGFKLAYRDKAIFPGEPVTAFDEERFQEMLLSVQTDLRLLDYARCFLKPDDLVVSTTSVHATGCDHFEAMLRYEDVAEFYLPEEKYWVDGPELPTLADLRAAEPVPDNGVGYSDYWLLAELQSEDIALYCESDEPNGYVFLRTGEKVQAFEQLTLTPRMILPQIYFEDLDGDGEKELLVIYYIGSGTGVSVEELVVYDDWSEDTGWTAHTHDPRPLIDDFNANRVYEWDKEEKSAYVAYNGGEDTVDLTDIMEWQEGKELDECILSGWYMEYTWENGEIELSIEGEIKPSEKPNTLFYAFTYSCPINYNADGTFTEGTGRIE